MKMKVMKVTSVTQTLAQRLEDDPKAKLSGTLVDHVVSSVTASAEDGSSIHLFTDDTFEVLDEIVVAIRKA